MCQKTSTKNTYMCMHVSIHDSTQTIVPVCIHVCVYVCYFWSKKVYVQPIKPIHSYSIALLHLASNYITRNLTASQHNDVGTLKTAAHR